jgi:HAMP domain-containing protein
MGLRTKFNLMLLFVFAIGLGASGAFSYRLLQTSALEDVLRQARVMIDSALAVRGYTVQQIKPLLEMQMRRAFLPQSVPSYSATETFSKLHEKYPEYSYKEATLNPTNPRDRATDWEADLINEFRNNPDKTELIGERDTPAGRSLYLAHPIQIKDPACLACHSAPDQAPATMIKLYGRDNGFGWKPNEIVGAQVVSVPTAIPMQRAMTAFQVFMGSLAGIFALLFAVLNLMLGRLVVRPLSRMSRLADQISMGNLDMPELPEKGRDQVAVLARSFNRMRRSLERAMKMVEG